MKIIVLMAMVLLAAGVTVNVPVLARLFTVDGTIESAAFRMAIRGLQAVLILSGLGLLLAGKFMGPARTRRLMARAALLATSLLFSLLLAEGLVRLIMPTPFALSETRRLFEYHERLGHRFSPGKSGLSVVPFESKNLVVINSHGMRHPEISREKPPGVKRLAVLGDSFTSNLPVPQRHVFTEVMNRQLGPEWEVLNFGVDGYTTLQEWIQFEEMVVDFDPDAVLVVFYLRNDLEDNHGFPDRPNYRPLARLSDAGELEVYNIPCPLPPQLQAAGRKRPRLLITDFHLYNLIKKVLFVRENVLANAYPEIPLFDTRLPDSVAGLWQLFEVILARFKESCDARGIPLVLVHAPTILQVYEAEYWEEVQNSRNLHDHHDPDLPSRLLDRICADLDIPFVDLLPGLRAYAETGELLYYRIYQHWNLQGNRRVGEILADFVQRELP